MTNENDRFIMKNVCKNHNGIIKQQKKKWETKKLNKRICISQQFRNELTEKTTMAIFIGVKEREKNADKEIMNEKKTNC